MMQNLAAAGGSKVILIPNDSCGRIIGKGGAMIRQLEAQSGCSIKMQNEPTPGSDTRPITLEGSPNVIAAAQVLIMDKVSEGQQRQAGTWEAPAGAGGILGGGPPPARGGPRAEGTAPQQGGGGGGSKVIHILSHTPAEP
ncbi:hypothetical protein T484DRAFT_1746390 [Baffinella frigidus]|nr:hypothetical protein T484DRAFT_1746390 [Cryptophyta sp. CCMP2293]